nr:S28 family serine protease [Myxococcus sp. RHSTA-1-4]
MLLQACGDTTLTESGARTSPPVQAAGALAAGVDSEDILARLQSIPGLTVVGEVASPFPGTRFFRLYFEQPADHRRPEGERFQMRATLLHRSVDAPVVLYSGGYGLGGFPSEYEPTRLLGANQLSLEHRFFGSSRPDSNDWKLLDIRQAAGDYHRIIQAFKPLYTGRWLTTGGSKGGMAAVYHRYFHPDDVDATLAYVAPNVHGLDDVRFVHFLNQVGDEDCRARLRAFQQDALRRREELLPFVEELVTSEGASFGLMGLDRALEFAVVEMPFYFWQYGNASRCAEIPAPGAPAEETFAFLEGIVGLDYTYGDLALDYFAAYYYQSATEIGWNRYPTRHLHGLLRYPREDVPTTYLSFPVEERFDHGLMLRVEQWVRNQGERMLFLYGDHDPWSAGPFEVRERNDSFRFYVPDANHTNARIVRLPEPERTLALSRLFTWMGVTPPAAAARALAAEAVEDAAPVVEGRSRL